MFFKPTLFAERIGDKVRVSARWGRKKKLPRLGLKPWIMSEEAFLNLETGWEKRPPPKFLDEKLDPLPFPIPFEAPFDRLLPHQREGVRLLLGGRRLLCDEMGVGKTLQALAFASIVQKNLSLSVCIVCPSYLQATWRKEMLGWVEADVYSYTLLSRFPKRYGLFILDEAHYIKSKDSKRSKALRKMCRGALALLLTGTPQKNRPNEIWALLNALRLGPTWGVWIRRYCKAHRNPFGGIDSRGASLQGEMWEYLNGQMVRRRSLEVLRLPEKKRRMVQLTVPLSARMRAKFARWREINRRELTEKSEKERKKLIMDLYVLTGEAKREKILAYLREQTPPYLVFAVHVNLLASLHEACEHNSELLHGGISTEERSRLVDNFQKGKGDILFMSIGACSTGLTITRASRIIFCEWTFSPADLEQAEARAWRFGQTSEVQIDYLHAPGTLDDWLVKSLKRKLSLQT